MYKHVITLLKKDLLLELRQQYTFYGVLLYVASSIFVLYLAIQQPESDVWNGLFWIIQLFICVNAVAKSFFAGNQGGDAVFLRHCRSAAFYHCQIDVQYFNYAPDELDQPVAFSCAPG